MINGKTLNNKFFPLIFKIIIGIILVFITSITILFLYIFIPYIFEDKITHVGYTPPKNGERASAITGIDIKGKGFARFFYWPDGSFALTNIGSFSTVYDCYYVNSDGVRTKYMGTSELYFGPDSPYKKWFPYTVLNPKNLEDHYDEIVQMIKTFPTASPEPRYNEFPTKAKPVVQPKNMDYVFQIKTLLGENGSCDLFQFRQK